MLIVFAIFADRITNGHHSDNVPIEKAMAVFSFVLFLAYGSFASLLLLFQKDIIKDGECTRHVGRRGGALCVLGVLGTDSDVITDTAVSTTTAAHGIDDAVGDDEEMGEDDLPPENI